MSAATQNLDLKQGRFDCSLLLLVMKRRDGLLLLEMKPGLKRRDRLGWWRFEEEKQLKTVAKLYTAIADSIICLSHSSNNLHKQNLFQLKRKF